MSNLFLFCSPFDSPPAWDAAEKVAYHAKPFEDLSADEKRAALYLGRSPLDYKLKNIKWEAINDTMKRHATALGWTEDTWNRNFPIYDLDIEYLYWSELTDEQKDAACYFGYNQNLWDETHEEEDFDGSVSIVYTGVIVASKFYNLDSLTFISFELGFLDACCRSCSCSGYQSS